VTANLLGYPKPKVTVLLNERPITSETTITEDEDGETHIKIAKLGRAHSGRVSKWGWNDGKGKLWAFQLWIRANNELGEDSVYVDLKVQDVPAAPRRFRNWMNLLKCFNFSFPCQPPRLEHHRHLRGPALGHRAGQRELQGRGEHRQLHHRAQDGRPAEVAPNSAENRGPVSSIAIFSCFKKINMSNSLPYSTSLLYPQKFTFPFQNSN
jgi:hypothetical protein